MKRMVKLVAGAVTFGLLSGSVFTGTEYMINKATTPASTQTKQTATTLTSQKAEQGENSVTQTSTSSEREFAGVSDVAEYVLPSIVAIDVTAVSKQQDFFGRTYESEQTGSGSGILIQEDENAIYIATNNHVVEDSTDVQITFSDETKASAKVVGTDASSDLAVVKVEKSELSETTLSGIKVAEIADSTKIKVGEQAIAIGNALGYGTSVTVGYVSAKDREISTSTEESGSTMKLIQTDAAINPGNSGGALVNSKGQVIGINSSKFASEEVEGMGFAIPISDAMPILKSIIDENGNHV
ncbi:MAG: trypsin-like peptidase domain-containing protein [Clostridiales bacterium]|nr:trypsin-like peptidase domain-containing protein [Clostridiales bacterium]